MNWRGPEGGEVTKESNRGGRNSEGKENLEANLQERENEREEREE